MEIAKEICRGYWRPARNGPTAGWPRSRALIVTAAAALVFSMLVAPAMALAQAEVRVAMHHVIVELAAPERLNVREQVILENAGSSSLSPAKPLRFNLPVAAQNVDASGSVEVQVKEGYLEVAGPLPPWMTSISFNYALTSDIPLTRVHPVGGSSDY